MSEEARREETCNRLVAHAETLRLHSADLDELVHEIKAEEAASINNGGVESQLDYLLESGMEAGEITKLLNKVAEEEDD